MTGFWLASALLILMALGFVLPPLLRVPAHAGRVELERALRAGVLDESEYARKLSALKSPEAHGSTAPTDKARALAVFLAVFVPLASILLYGKLGDPRVFDPDVQSVSAAMQQAQQAGLPAMDQAIAGLAERLAREPDDLEGWVLLGRAYKSTEHFEEARDALARALSLAPEEPGLMVEYAEVRTLAAPDRRFAGEALELIERALEIDPTQQRGLWLRGIAHYQEGEPEAAAATWQRLLALLPEDSPVRTSVLAQIGQLQGADPATAPDAAAAPGAPAATASPRLTVRVSLAPELTSRVRDDDVVFVYARAATGSRAPLAIQRRRAAELPLVIELGDADAMVPQMNLSSAARIVLGARISRSGEAQAQPGDLEALSGVLPNSHAEAVELSIDHIVP